MALNPRLVPLVKHLNPYMVGLARRVPPFVTIAHTGRVTGKRFTTPVLAFAAREPLDLSVTEAPGLPVQTKGVRDILVAIPMPYGDDTDWVQNVLHEGAFELTRKGITYRVTEPRVVDGAEAARVGVKASVATTALGIDRFLLGTLHRISLPDL